MLVHSVYFWLHKNHTSEELAEFIKGAESLKGIDVAEAVYVGAPAPTERPVVDGTYDVSLTVLLRDMEGHDAYQAHPLHKAFVEKYGPYWSRVVIYDSLG